MNPLTISPLAGTPDARVTLPGSKSITNRALVLAALASGESVLTGALFSEDTAYMAAALGRLGIVVQQDKAAARFVVQGGGGHVPVDQAEIFVGNSGTTARFLTALLALGHGRYRLDGTHRMQQRPMQDLLDALEGLGVHAYSEAGNGCLPVVVEANGLGGGATKLRGDVSSQYLTALLMATPCTERGGDIEIVGELTAKPYVDITLRMLRQWGAEASHDGAYRRFHVVGGQCYTAHEYAIEPDASSASYFFAAAAVTGGRVTVEGLSADALQGDVKFTDILEQMGCAVERGEHEITVQGPARLHGIDADMNGISDTALTLAAIAPFADGPTTIRNVAHIRHQECDRIRAAVTELRRLGVEADERPDGFTIHPAEAIRPALVQTYDDHRVAMSFAVTGLRAPGVQIADPDCVAKTFPDFWRRLESLRGAG